MQELGEKDLENTVENFKKILENNNANLTYMESLHNLKLLFRQTFLSISYKKSIKIIINQYNH